MTVARVTPAKTSSTKTKRISHRQSVVHAEQAFNYFRRVRPRLFKDPAYRGKFVAIRDRQVVDVGEDKLALYDRLLGRFPDHRFVVSQVLSEIPSISMDSLH